MVEHLKLYNIPVHTLLGDGVVSDGDVLSDGSDVSDHLWWCSQ